MTSIGSLRMFALASNVLFSSYGLIAHIYPVVFLHMVLLPINLLKLYRLQYRKAAQG
jgi:formate hydrogenlyase subunit 4